MSFQLTRVLVLFGMFPLGITPTKHTKISDKKLEAIYTTNKLKMGTSMNLARNN